MQIFVFLAIGSNRAQAASRERPQWIEVRQPTLTGLQSDQGVDYYNPLAHQVVYLSPLGLF